MSFGNQTPPRFTLAIESQDIKKLKTEWCDFLFAQPTLPPRTHSLNVHEGTLERSAAGIERIRLTYDVEPGVSVEAYLLRHTAAKKNCQAESLSVSFYFIRAGQTILTLKAR